MLSIQTSQPVWMWTESATCCGRRSTKSGVRNISAATPVTSTNRLFPSSHFLPLLSGGAQKATNPTQMPVQTLATDPKMDTLPRWTSAPLHHSRPATAALLHLRLQATAALHHLSRSVTVIPLHLTHPATAGRLPLSHPVMVAPHHVKTELTPGHFSRTSAIYQVDILQRAPRK